MRFYTGTLRRLGLIASLLVVSTGDVMATILAGLGLTMAFIARVRLAGLAVLIMGLGSFFLIHRLGSGIGYMDNGGGLEHQVYGRLLGADKIHGLLHPGCWCGSRSHPVPRADGAGRAIERDLREPLPGRNRRGRVPLDLGRLGDHPDREQPHRRLPLLAAVVSIVSALCVYRDRDRRVSDRASHGARTAGSSRIAACALLALNAAGWTVAWLPRIPSNWILVRPAAAAELSRIDAAIPRTEEVVAGPAFIGRFADRPLYYNGMHFNIPVMSSPLHVLIAPYDGINGARYQYRLRPHRGVGARPASQAGFPSQRRVVVFVHALSAYSAMDQSAGPYGRGARLDLGRRRGQRESSERTIERWWMVYDHRRGIVFFGDYENEGSYHRLACPDVDERVIAALRDAPAVAEEHDAASVIEGPTDRWRMACTITGAAIVFFGDYWRVPEGAAAITRPSWTSRPTSR